MRHALALGLGFVIGCGLSAIRRDGLTLDARGIPTHACPACGHTFFRFVGRFKDFELSFYVLDGECDNCGALVTLPTAVDAPDYDG